MASAIRNLLDELSWEGNSTSYRGGGPGKENVLTAEVWQALDTLPRSDFLGAVLARVHRVERPILDRAGATSGDPFASPVFARPLECEVLCGDRLSTVGSVRVQPDVLLESDDAVVIVEAKKARGGVFQREQIARNALVLDSLRGGRPVMLLLLLGTPPPIRVRGLGRVSVQNALETGLEAIRVRDARTPGAGEIGVTIAWTTWSEITETVSEALGGFDNEDSDVVESVRRQARLLLEAITFHS